MFPKLPNRQGMVAVLQTGPLGKNIEYGAAGAVLTPLLDAVVRKLVTIPAYSILPQIPTLDQFLMLIGVPSTILVAGAAMNNPKLAWAGLGGLLVGGSSIVAQTVNLNLSNLLGTVSTASAVTATVLNQHGY